MSSNQIDRIGTFAMASCVSILGMGTFRYIRCYMQVRFYTDVPPAIRPLRCQDSSNELSYMEVRFYTDVLPATRLLRCQDGSNEQIPEVSTTW